MFELAWPWLLALLPLPWIARRWLAPVERDLGAALRVPDLADFSALSSAGHVARRSRAWWAAIFAWVLLVAAAARPQWLGDTLELPMSGRDLMIAVDLSESMETTDFELRGEPVGRLVAAKAVVREFIERRTGDRIGVILFGTQAYLQAPLTFDRQTAIALLDEAVIGLAGGNTAIGDAIGLAVKRLREETRAEKVLILVTDGANTAGAIDPLRAADLAAAAGLRIYTIGIGADEMSRQRQFGLFRARPMSDLDEKTLKAIAKATRGHYYRARDLAELERIYADIDKLEPIAHSGENFRPVTQLFYWPLGAALLVAALVTWRNLRGTA
jgi:Ca-activated chloride channel family protein